MAFGISAQWLGLIVSGDLDGCTIYTDRYGKKVWFPVAPPLSPPSFIQIWQRGRFRTAMEAWTLLTKPEQELYRQAVKKLYLCMPQTGLWCCLCLQSDNTLYQTIKRQSGLNLAPPLKV